MTIFDRSNPYIKRRRPRAYKHPPLRQETTQYGERTTKHGTSPAGIGDTRDAHLNGKGSPFSAAHKGKK